MRVPVKSLLVSIAVFVLLCGTILFLVFMYLTDQTPRDVINDINNTGKLFLYKYGMVENYLPVKSRASIKIPVPGNVTAKT